ncbi:ABC superfamily ATP binding cassette transporter, binding protein [Cutibacterium avidum ATCC 25577]|uniref:ABC superfamily ATP binding cassette transporter, binding protein n=2 Tax=Cutibacterium avidum TaxID=33010 RepID=G4CXY6_9ACTN|nr:ABC superfamily ATP binding cassette transporter, binding protein [Cutibacterium avidum ATCC 25577]
MSALRTRRTTCAAAATLAGLCALSMSACAGSSTDKSSPSASASSAPPRTVLSCTEKLSFTDSPKRVIMLGDIDASTMAALGVLDHVIGRAGQIKEDAFDAGTLAKIKAIPQIASQELDTGGAKVSTETILNQHADLVIGYDTGVDRAALRKAGVKTYSPDAMCPDKAPASPATFSLVTQEVTKIGNIFNVADKAKEVNKNLEGKIKKIESQAGSGTKDGAAALYITPGSTEFYTYGSSSMVQPILDANGLKNLYGNNSKRVFDASMEDVLHKNPKWIVLLAGTGDASKVESTFLGFKGAKELDAVKNGHVVVLPFSLIDPPSPSSITGVEKLHELMEEK